MFHQVTSHDDEAAMALPWSQDKSRLHCVSHGAFHGLLLVHTSSQSGLQYKVGLPAEIAPPPPQVLPAWVARCLCPPMNPYPALHCSMCHTLVCQLVRLPPGCGSQAGRDCTRVPLVCGAGLALLDLQ